MRLVFRHMLALLAVFGFAAGLAAAEPNGDYLLQEIEELRAGTSDYVYIHGGFFDGGAMGQTTTFVVTPDDRLQCVFVFSLDFLIIESEEDRIAAEKEGLILPPSGGEVKSWSYDQVVPGLYARLKDGVEVLENAGSAPSELGEANFLVEVSQGANKTWAETSWGDDLFQWISDVLFTDPQPTECWSWG